MEIATVPVVECEIVEVCIPPKHAPSLAGECWVVIKDQVGNAERVAMLLSDIEFLHPGTRVILQEQPDLRVKLPDDQELIINQVMKLVKII